MWSKSLEGEGFKAFSKHAKIAGIVLMLLGTAGIIFPQVMSVVVVILVAWLLLIAGLVSGLFTLLLDSRSWLGWLKSAILVFVGAFLIFYPLPGVATLGLIFAIYFFVDGFSGLSLALYLRPNRGWWIWLANGSLSIGLGILFLWQWPFSAAWLVGLFIGISLLFDGLSFFLMGRVLNEVEHQKK
jgi:uncharacterized membrane protein HdeD (DUF308 family)